MSNHKSKLLQTKWLPVAKCSEQNNPDMIACCTRHMSNFALMAYNLKVEDKPMPLSNYNKAGEATALAIVLGLITLVISIVLEVNENQKKKNDGPAKKQDPSVVELAEKDNID